MQAAHPSQRVLKRGDLVVEQIKRWITERNLRPGARLPKEQELQAHFGVSRGTMREALKALEVQGLISLSTGPGGGATIEAVSLDRTFQFLQNYLFFQDIDVHDIYAVRRILEPALAAAAVPHLGEEHFVALERCIACCEPMAGTAEALRQRTEDLHFHDILAEACPNAFLRFHCRLINALLQTLVVGSVHVSEAAYQALGKAAVVHHRRILAAARRQDATRVARLMLAHIADTEQHLEAVQAELRSKLLLDSEMKLRPAMAPLVPPLP
ncbi:FadR family transcriptional regulator [Mitsuaria sp. WAJ17]|nr:FadR family transcriptional regulator [Mitsuaria sp. WAJ17]